MYPSANALGISYTEYWEMEPVEVQRVALMQSEKFKNEANYQLSLAWYGAVLQGIAMNDPKKFPKKPPTIEDENEKADRSKLLAYKLDALYKSGMYSKKE